jgi:hypothetical protein
MKRAAGALLLFACAASWGKPDDVVLAAADQVAGCKQLGATLVSVPAALGVVRRTEEAVEDNLLVAARREADRRGGDTVVKGESAEFGSRRFDIYRCN